MKKTGIAILAAVLLCGCFGTGAETQSLGGWQINTEFTPVLREEEELLFEKARAADGGYTTLIPVTVLASQVVSGKNHCVLCEGNELVFVYENLEGKTEVTQRVAIDLGAFNQ